MADDDEKRETAEQESTHQAVMRDEEIQVNDVEEREREFASAAARDGGRRRRAGGGANGRSQRRV